MPYPLESRLEPIFIVSQGSLRLVYSFVVDSSRNAYRPLDSLTFFLPSSVEFTNTSGTEFMYANILSYRGNLDFWKIRNAIQIISDNGKTQVTQLNLHKALKIGENRIDAFQRNYIEKAIRWSIFQSTVLNLGLLGQVFNRINWRIHSVHCQEGGQVRRVRWNDDQCKEPPHTTYNPSWHCSENRRHQA